MLKLYYTPNTCALASHIALEQTGADYEAIRVNFAANEQRKPEYLAINPKGRVPALVTERGVLTETPAILVFIAQSYPAARLAPLDDVFALAQVQAFNSYLCSTVHVAHSHRMRGTRWVDDPAAIVAMQRKVPRSVGEGFELIEREMLKGPWVMGDAYSICDMYLFTLSQWLEDDGVDTGKLPRVMDTGAGCRNSPWSGESLRLNWDKRLPRGGMIQIKFAAGGERTLRQPGAPAPSQYAEPAIQ